MSVLVVVVVVVAGRVASASDLAATSYLVCFCLLVAFAANVNKLINCLYFCADVDVDDFALRAHK